MRRELPHYAAGLKGRIRLLSNTAALAGFLPPRLCRFLAAYPDLSVDLEERPSSEIALALAEGRADLGVVADIADLMALQARVVARDHSGAEVAIQQIGHDAARAEAVGEEDDKASRCQ